MPTRPPFARVPCTIGTGKPVGESSTARRTRSYNSRVSSLAAGCAVLVQMLFHGRTQISALSFAAPMEDMQLAFSPNHKSNTASRM